MARIGPVGDIFKLGMIRAVRRAAFENKPAIAVTAIDITMLIDLKIDLWMAQRRRAIVCAAADRAGAITADAFGLDGDQFGCLNAHDCCR